MLSHQILVTLLCILLVHTISADLSSGKLTCNETSMIVKFNKTMLEEAGRNYTIMFKGEKEHPCMVNTSMAANMDEDYIWIMADYNECGIDVYESNGMIVYNQTVIVSYGKNPNSTIIYRVHLDEYQIKCTKRNNITASIDAFNVTSEGKVYSKVGETNFEVELHKYMDNTFMKQDESGKSELGEMMFFKLELKTPREDISISPQNCYAKNGDKSMKYMIITNGCINRQDKTVKILSKPQDKKTFTWQVESFKFFGKLGDKIYIQCDALVCTSTSTDPRCRRCGVVGRRRRRDVADLGDTISKNFHTQPVSVRTGLIVLVKENDQTQTTSQSETSVFSGPKGTTIIILLAVLVFILAVAVIKKFFFTPSHPQHPSIPMTGMECGIDNKSVY